MNVGDVKEYKLEIGNKEYTFRLDFAALIKFNEKYKGYKVIPVLEDGNPKFDKSGNQITLELGAMDIFNDFINGKDQYGGLVKILSCACIDKDLTEEELLNKLSFDFPTMKVLDAITLHMIKGSLVVEKKKEKSNESNEKN